jgi:hypothetical protein
LGARPTGNPNIPRRHNDEFTGGKLVAMLLQRFIQVVDLGLQLGPGNPEEQDAGVSKPLMEKQLAEIAIGNDQNPLLLPRELENILISKPRRIVARDRGNIMAEASKMGDQSKISALVEKEFHTGVASEAAPLGGFGETSSPVTIALA